MHQSPSASILTAVAEIQRGFVLVKTNQNEQLRSKYCDEADVRLALDPKLTEKKLGVSFIPGKIRAEGEQHVLELTLIVFNTDTGESIKETGEFGIPEGNRAVSFAQSGGSALSYARRNFLISFFGIITGDDNDAKRAQESTSERDAPGGVSPTAHWKLLMDGYWHDAPLPDGKGCLGEITPEQKASLWKKYPQDAALTAWAADRLVGTLSELGFDWPVFCERAGGSWPEALEDCTPEQVRAAAIAAKALLKGGAQ